MGRSVFADAAVEKYIEKLLKLNKWFVGVIIGTLSSQRDHVVWMARTPDPVEDEASEDNGENDGGDGNKHEKAKVERPTELADLEEKWVSTHARQVSRMLPGGLSVIGLFALAPPNVLQRSQVKLKQMMLSVHRNLTKNSLLSSDQDINDRILLQMDTSSKKITCLSLDVSDGRNGFRPAEWRIQSGSSRWVRLNSHINLDIPISIPEDKKSQSLLRQLQTGLSDFCGQVRKSIITVDGTLRDMSESLVPSAEKKAKGKDKAGSSSNSRLSHEVNIHLPFVNAEPHKDPIVCDACANIKVVGTTVVRAFVPARATVGEAIQALKTDVIRSLFARCELLCEEYELTENKQDSEVYDPPVRLFCCLPSGDVDVCDYTFQDEKKAEVVQRISELLDVEVQELEEVERNMDEDTWSQHSSLSASSGHSIGSRTELTAGSSSSFSMIGAVLGGLAAIFAVVMCFVFMIEDA